MWAPILQRCSPLCWYSLPVPIRKKHTGKGVSPRWCVFDFCARFRASRHLIRLPEFARVLPTAGVLTTVMLAAGMAFLMVMVADGVRVKGQVSGSQLLYCSQGVAGYTRIELDSSLNQSSAGAGADAATDELFGTQTVQEASQCAVTAAQYGSPVHFPLPPRGTAGSVRNVRRPVHFHTLPQFSLYLIAPCSVCPAVQAWLVSFILLLCQGPVKRAL